MYFTAFNILVLFSVTINGQGCIFPKYLLAGDSGVERIWEGHITKESSYTVTVTFHDYMMKATVKNRDLDSPESYTRKCIERVSSDTFVVLHHENDIDQEMYACMQILKRSDHVIQLKESDLHPNIDVESLCAPSHTVLSKWPLVNNVGINKVRDPCPLVGGFNLRIYDSESSSHIMQCNALEGEMRLESDCEEGEGMEFQFRHSMCVPHGINMRINQRVYCIASWIQDSYTFAVIKHDKINRQWVLRYKKYDPTSFVGLLFSDIICDSEPHQNLITSSFLRLDIVKAKTQSMSNLCIDGYEGCEVWQNPCSEQGSKQQLTCPKRCGLCEDVKPSHCSLPNKLYGQWVEDSTDGQRLYNIDGNSLLIHGTGRMKCVDWETGVFKEPDRLEQMTVTTFNNGCRARYQCMQLYRRSRSILRFRLSQSQRWPFEGTTGFNIDCSLFSYRDSHDENGIRSRHHKILVSNTERAYVKCGLPQTRQFEVTFNSHRPTTCNGTLTSDMLLTGMKLTLSLYGCDTHTDIQRFSCLDSSKRGLRDDLMIVTESLEHSSQFRCWLFPSYSSGRSQFYLLPASMCNEWSREQIQQGVLEPLAVFTDFEEIIPEQPAELEDYNPDMLDIHNINNGDVGKTSRHAEEQANLMESSATILTTSIYVNALCIFTMFLSNTLFYI